MTQGLVAENTAQAAPGSGGIADDQAAARPRSGAVWPALAGAFALAFSGPVAAPADAIQMVTICGGGVRPLAPPLGERAPGYPDHCKAACHAADDRRRGLPPGVPQRARA